MYLRRLTLDGRDRWYLFFGQPHIAAEKLDAAPVPMPAFDTHRRSRFYLYPAENILLKARVDKHTPRNVLRWIGRLVSDRLLMQNNPRKEYLGNQMYQRAGLNPVSGAAWAIALNPFNQLGSLYAMDHIPNAVNGREFFDGAPEQEKCMLIDVICDGVAKLGALGYYNRDQHLGNIMLTDSGHIVWIDTHVSRLPSNKKARNKRLMEATAYKLRSQPEYRTQVLETLARLLN